MNRYGRLAMRHWEEFLPAAYVEIPDPAVFFTSLGREVSDAVTELAEVLAGSAPAGEEYPARVARLATARTTAEERVLAERVYLTPEVQEPAGPERGLVSGWIPLEVDPQHPYWRDTLAEEALLAEEQGLA